MLLAFEPHTGFRYVQVRARRTAIDYAQFLQALVRRHYSTVEQIRLVQDNLNTHTLGAFYHVLPPEEAFQFAQRFDLHYTPKKASWLNMANRVCGAGETMPGSPDSRSRHVSQRNTGLGPQPQ